MRLKIVFLSIIALTIYGIITNFMFLPRLFLIPTIAYLTAWLLLLFFAVKADSKKWRKRYQLFWIVSTLFTIFAALTVHIPDSAFAIILLPGYFLFLYPMLDVSILFSIFFNVEQGFMLAFLPICLIMLLLGLVLKRKSA